MSTVVFPTLAFLGAGNMAGSLVRGLIAQGVDPAHVRMADPFEAQLEPHKAAGIATFTDNARAIDGAQMIVLAVKPQIAAQVLQPLTLAPDQVLVSIAAGIDMRSLAAWTSTRQPIVRCMPNTPALMGAGMTAAFANAHCDQTQKDAAFAVLQAAGVALWVDEEAQLDAVTAVSGSGPAYFFQLMEAMVDAGVELGLSEDVATQLTIQTAYGAAIMARDGEDSPGLLRSKVTSPGGTTAAAIEVMTRNRLPAVVKDALVAANDRAGELAEEFGAKS